MTGGVPCRAALVPSSNIVNLGPSLPPDKCNFPDILSVPLAHCVAISPHFPRHREGNTSEQTREIFKPLFIDLADIGHLKCIHLVLCGPNISRGLHGTRYSYHASVKDRNFVISSAQGPPSGARPLDIHLTYNASLYHDVSGEFMTPNALFLFNAGIWGYDDWIPTLEHVLLKSLNRSEWPSQVAMVVTSYCAEEADDDMETIEKVLLRRHDQGPNNPHVIEAKQPSTMVTQASAEDKGRSAGQPAAPEWLWRPEINPHRSLVERESSCAVEGRHLFENHTWQAIKVPQ